MFNFLFNEYLEDGEKIYYVAHSHPLVFFRAVARTLLWHVILPILLTLLFADFFYFAMLWLGIGVIRILYEFANWFFDAWILTNTSVIDLDWISFFNRSSNRIEYHMIEGVSYTYNGFWQTVFRFGDVYIQRVGSGLTFCLKDGMSPRRVESEVLRLQAKFVTDKTYRDHDSLKALLSEMIHQHVSKKK